MKIWILHLLIIITAFLSDISILFINYFQVGNSLLTIITPLAILTNIYSFILYLKTNYIGQFPAAQNESNKFSVITWLLITFLIGIVSIMFIITRN